ncbi:MAG: alpha-ketoglutarate-dependent dioxygenase AlkB [Lentimicrobium sp.]|jgi:alkylated DNA repair dioxygenase AlkB|nr:alpha-ketoglutarate-dependent dioxygenase AlkB [Lentimicrobium sp.]
MLFDASNNQNHEIPLNGGRLDYYPSFLSVEDAQRLMQQLIQEINWGSEKFVIFGKTYESPRLIAWYGEAGAHYSYSGIQHSPEPFTEILLQVKQRIEQLTGHAFNSVLLNWYRSGADSMGWHADDEKALGVNPVIASLSLGQTRNLRFRRKDNHRSSFHVSLQTGSLLLMSGELQHHWQHALPKSKKPMESRINLTFRLICSQ